MGNSMGEHTAEQLPDGLDIATLTGYMDGVDAVSLAAILPETYGALRAIAANQLRKERPGHTLDTGALVHEAYLKLEASFPQIPDSREKFLCLCAGLMRQVLVDHARRRRRIKRGGDAVLTTFTESVASAAGQSQVDVLAIDAAIERLGAMNAEHGRIVECRFFAGMSIEETARALGSSATSVKRGWRLARAWLQQELGPQPAT